MSLLTPELVGKCLEQLKQAVPRVSRVAVLWNPGVLGERTEKDMLKEAEVAGRALRVRVQVSGRKGYRFVGVGSYDGLLLDGEAFSPTVVAPTGIGSQASLLEIAFEGLAVTI